MLSEGAFSAIGSGVSTLGSLASSFIAASMGSKGQYRSYKYNKKLQQQQYKLQQQGYREGPTNARYGLEAAGINPILAANNGSAFAGVGAGGSVGSPSYPTTPDLGNGLTNAFKAFNLEKKQTEANIENLGSQTASNNAQASLAKEQAITEENKRLNLDMDSALKEANKIKTDKETSWIDKKNATDIETAIINAKSNSAIAAAQSVNAQSAFQNAQTNAKQQALNELTGIQEQKYRDEHPFYNWADRWTSVAGRVFGGAGAAAQGYSAVKNAHTNASHVTEINNFGQFGDHKSTKRIIKKALRRR